MRRALVGLARPRPDPLKVDRGLAVLLTVGLELEIWLGSAASDERLPTAVLGAVVTGAVAVRRRYPATVGIGAGLIAGLVAAVSGPPSLLSWGVAWICCMYALAVWAQPRRFAVGLAVVTAVSFASAAGSHVRASDAVTFGVVTLVVMLLVNRVVGDRERRARIAERERDLAAREAVVEERARIARELHDAIAHNVSMIVVQAGAERRVLEGSNDSTRDVLQTIEQIGRGALTEMRRLVGMLRSEAGDPLAPQPGLADVPALVTQVREAGLPTELRVEGDRRELPVGIELSAYRIVQEALTNVLKHAGRARASVSIRYGPESLEVEVVDDGASNGSAPRGTGHGLVGMRERVALYGGRFEAAHDPGGGFAVRATLPVA